MAASNSVCCSNTLTYDPSRYLLTSVDLPTVTRVVEASHDTPCLAIAQRSDRLDDGKLRKAPRVEELADVAGMGVSTLHHHFRALTTMSPLHYQKQIRLQAARARMLANSVDAATVAFEVG